jgi:hypothetical protein
MMVRGLGLGLGLRWVCGVKVRVRVGVVRGYFMVRYIIYYDSNDSNMHTNTIWQEQLSS